jgi:enamine deaminase RidA (YjgF/YER057c/UK114 family)
MTAEQRLRELAIQLPPPPPAGGNYRPYRRSGNQLFLAGVISIAQNGDSWQGQVGDSRTIEEGYAAARLCALNVLATLREITGSLDAISQLLYLGGYVNAVAGFDASPQVINGASDLFIEVLGEAGQHARAAIAVAGLPKNATVEIQTIVELKA